jgi:REP element-mobilizing transposase RayT
MPWRGNIFQKGHPVHIVSRAVEERKIFNNEVDCFRYIYQIYAANVGKPIHTLWRQDIIKITQAILWGEEIPSKFIIREHSPLVLFLDFALVVNHAHLYLVPNTDNAIPVLMNKVNGGFAKYFNLKYKRKGSLFGTRYRSIIIKTQFQSDAVSRYVSIINPLDVFQPGWREKGLKKPQKAYQFLKDYQFSSFPDKIGKRRSKILAPPEILKRYLTIDSKETTNYRKFTEEFLKEKSNIPNSFYLE